MIGSGRLGRVAAMTGGVVLAVAVAAPVSASKGPAGFEPTEISGTLGRPCIRVAFDGPTQLTVAQRRDGKTVKSVSYTADGYDRVCLTAMRAGDRIRISQGGTVLRTAKVPAIGLVVDRATDSAQIQVPIGVTDATAFAQDLVAGAPGGLGVAELFTPDPDGSHEFDVTGLLDLGPGDPVSVGIKTGIDRWSRIDVSASAVVRVGSSVVEGSAPLGSTATVTLKNAAGTLRGTAVARKVGLTSPEDDVRFSSRFRKNGATVNVKPGDRVRHSQMSTSFTVPARSLAVDVPSASLTMTCPANGQYVVLVNGSRVGSGSSGTGAITQNQLDVDDPLVAGTTIEVRCDTRRGYAISERVVLD
jgi:hypothetical protein